MPIIIIIIIIIIKIITRERLVKFNAIPKPPDMRETVRVTIII